MPIAPRSSLEGVSRSRQGLARLSWSPYHIEGPQVVQSQGRTSAFTVHTHRIDVYLVNSNNTPIHTGSWSLSTKTYGRFLGTYYASSGNGRFFDVSNMDLRSLRNLRIVVT
jgi:hypothetical protein